MSFGFSVGDIISITQIAWKTAENTKHACIEYSDISQDILILHILLNRLKDAASDSQLRSSNKQDLSNITTYYGGQLRVLELMLEKFSKLSEGKGGLERLWQMIKFGNGKMQDLASIRMKLANYTTTITFLLSLLLLDSQSHDKIGAENNNSGPRVERKASV
jgi:hypothetical protein